MFPIKVIEKQIWDCEGFSVRIRKSDGQRLTKNTAFCSKPYTYKIKADNKSTVASWISSHFLPKYEDEGFNVVVLNGTGQPVNGKTILSTVRGTYSEQ
jgi:hypothetical protein